MSFVSLALVMICSSTDTDSVALPAILAADQVSCGDLQQHRHSLYTPVSDACCRSSYLLMICSSTITAQVSTLAGDSVEPEGLHWAQLLSHFRLSYLLHCPYKGLPCSHSSALLRLFSILLHQVYISGLRLYMNRSTRWISAP